MLASVIVVVGAGVSGLSSAVALQRAGYRVEIWARERPPHVTSSIAAAFWYPFRTQPEPRTLRWAATSYQRFRQLAGEPDAGVDIRPAYDLARAPIPRPWWADAVPTLRQATREELPPGFAFGWVCDAFVVDTRVYLPYLMARFELAGGRFVEHQLHDLEQAGDRGECVINCTGLGARQLCHDDQLYPLRGQLVHVSNPGLDRVILDEHGDDVTYVIPRRDECVLGATLEEDDDLRVDPEDADAIVARSTDLVPRLRASSRLAVKVGLRPARPSIRLEAERSRHGPVIHNYGHGGDGVTLSWGCADDVVTLVREHVRSR